MGWALPFVLLSFLPIALSDPLLLPFNDCFDGQGNSTQKVTINQVYAQVIQRGVEDVAVNLTVFGSNPIPIVGFAAGSNLATLFTSTSVLTLSLFSNSSYLCQSLIPPGPLNTTQTDTANFFCPINPGTFAFSSTIPWGSDRALTTVATRLRAVDPFGTEYFCIEANTTPLDPSQSSHSRFTSYGRAEIIFWSTIGLTAAYWVVVGLARLSSALNRGNTRPGTNKWSGVQSVGFILASAISGERFATSPALLRFSTPSPRDVLLHTQFCAVLGMMAVQWPMSAYPLLTQTAWATLAFNASMTHGDRHRWDPLHTDPFNPPSEFADQVADPNSPIYINTSIPNVLFSLPNNATAGLSSFAYTVGIRPQDLFPVALVLFLGIAAATIALSAVVWIFDMIGTAISDLTPSHQDRTMNRKGARSPAPKELLDQPLASTEEGKALQGRETPAAGRPSSRFGFSVTAPNSAALTKRHWWKHIFRTELGSFHGAVLQGNLVRILMLFHLPITIFSVYQMALPRSMASRTTTILAAFSFLVFSLAIPAMLMLRIRFTNTSKLYEETRTLLSLGPLYNQYRQGSQMFVTAFFACNVALGIVVGAGQKSGTAQAAILLVVEVASALITSVWLPWGHGAGMGLISFLFCVARIVVAVLMVILSPAIDIGAGAGGWVAYGIMVVLALVYLAQTLMLIVKIIEAAIRIFGGIGFDKSRHVVDSGLFGALGMLGCCGRRHRYRRRHKPLPSRTDSESGPVSSRYRRSGAASLSGSSVFSPHPASFALNPTGSRKGSYQSPPPSVLKPEQADNHYREENDDEHGFIMGAWQPFANSTGGYSPVNDSFGNTSAPAKTGFARVGGGKAHVDTPYAIAPSTARSFPTGGQQSPPLSGINDPRPETPLPLVANTAARQNQQVHERAGSLPPGALPPFHQRTKSQTAVIEDPAAFASSLSPRDRSRTDTSAPPSAFPQTFRAEETADLPNDDDDDDNSDEEQIEAPKKKWYQLRKNRPGSRGSTDDKDNAHHKSKSSLDDPVLETSSSSTPGRSFVVIRKPPAASPSRATPSTSAAGPGVGSSSAQGPPS